jgi:hypothetical protein
MKLKSKDRFIRTVVQPSSIQVIERILTEPRGIPRLQPVSNLKRILICSRSVKRNVPDASMGKCEHCLVPLQEIMEIHSSPSKRIIKVIVKLAKVNNINPTTSFPYFRIHHALENKFHLLLYKGLVSWKNYFTNAS